MPGVDHRAVVVENDSGKTGVAQTVAEGCKRFAPVAEFTRGGKVAWVDARFPGNRRGLPRREAWQPCNPPGAWERQAIELASERGHAGPTRVDAPTDPGPSREPERREQRSQRYGARTAVERDPRLRDICGDQVERALRKRAIRVSDEGEHGARLAPLGEPVMPTVGEVAVVGELEMAERSFCELRLEIDRPDPCGGAVEDEGGGSIPKRCRGLLPRIQSCGGIREQRLQTIHRILPISVRAKLGGIKPRHLYRIRFCHGLDRLRIRESGNELVLSGPPARGSVAA